MLIENSKYKQNGTERIIRICDECGKKENACLSSVLRGRRTRGKDIDLCRKCSYLSKYVDRNIIRGDRHHSWKHGLQGGYKRITVETGIREQEHRYVYEQYLGRKLNKKERIHHIDFDRLNNNIDNLVLFKNNGEHRKCHMENMEKCALFFLNNMMWFSFENKRYVLEYRDDCARKNIKTIEFDFIKKFKRKYGGVFCSYVDAKGELAFRQEHIIIMENFLGRRLYQGECVHHVDGNKYNNKIDNLVVLNKKQHYEAHYSLGYCLSHFFKLGLVGFDKEKKAYFVKDVT